MIRLRKCVSCRRVASQSWFWRVVRIFPSHVVHLDRGMGRSAYLCPNVRCLEIARKKRRLERSLRVPVPAQIYEELQERCSRLENPRYTE